MVNGSPFLRFSTPSNPSQKRESVHTRDIPDFVEEFIVNLSNENKVNADTLRAEYREIFSDSFIQNDPQFVTDLQRHHYAIQVLIARARAVKPDTAASRRQKADDCSK